jgi:hypothetical protein
MLQLGVIQSAPVGVQDPVGLNPIRSHSGCRS